MENQETATEFVRTPNAFFLPQTFGSRNSAEKRELTICNLFCNHQQSIADIVRVLDETPVSVVRALLTHQVVFDRRKERGAYYGPDRRRFILTIRYAPRPSWMTQ